MGVIQGLMSDLAAPLLLNQHGADAGLVAAEEEKELVVGGKSSLTGVRSLSSALLSAVDRFDCRSIIRSGLLSLNQSTSLVPCAVVSL